MKTFPSSYRERIESAVRDGGNMTNADARAFIDHLHDLTRALYFVMNDPTPHRWFDLKVVLDAGPIEPEP